MNSAPQSFLAMFDRLGLMYAGYRIVLSFFLLSLYLLTKDNPLIGAEAPQFYLTTGVGYFFATLVGYVVLRHWPFHQQNQLMSMLIIDVLAFSLMLYANGGPSLQMSMLYLVIAVAAHFLLPSVQAMMIALLAVITVVWQQFFFALTQNADLRSISGAVLLSLSFLGVSLLTRHMVRRLQLVERVAANQALQVMQLQAISQKIVERMQSGVLVLNPHKQVLLANHAAQQLLNRQIYAGYALTRVCAPLQAQLLDARQQQLDYFVMPPDSEGARQALGVQVLLLEATDVPPITLLMLEGLERVNQQAQQLKLASLGRLTASIAHEIRNPLAAISQATELLQDGVVSDADGELLGMIQKQTRRMNRIIEDILQLSRRQKAQPQRLQLDAWLPELIQEHFQHTTYLHLQVQADLAVHFDPNQLQQVLLNLLHNALYHAQKNSTQPQVRVLASADPFGRVSLDVIDNGAGVANHALATLFEPFFTTEPNGTGLGLYLARAFCEANGARLSYVALPAGACFRVVFALESSG